jgi:dienelactone hydrolase
MRLSRTGVFLLAVAGALSAQTGNLRDQVSTHYSPLAHRDVLTPRVVSPTEWDRLQRYQAERGVKLRAQTVDLSAERFDLYVPKTAPADGYAVLVFIPPMPEWPVPHDWKTVLEKHGMIYVAARASGNRQNVLDRRMPLALHALELVRQRYRIDDRHVYISGFSGGSRVANRLLRAYPDVFAGALLMAGSDPLGVRGSIVPAAELMRRYQSHSRIVFVTGQNDLPNRAQDEHTRASFVDYCVVGERTHLQRRLDHWIPDRRGFAAALQSLREPVVVPDAQAACLSALDARVRVALDEVDALIAAGSIEEAGIALGKVDDLYGGLAAERAVPLARRLAELRNAGAR